jgi:1,6-anhydro-N-acetylmuramate kinase
VWHDIEWGAQRGMAISASGVGGRLQDGVARKDDGGNEAEWDEQTTACGDFLEREREPTLKEQHYHKSYVPSSAGETRDRLGWEKLKARATQGNQPTNVLS